MSSNAGGDNRRKCSGLTLIPQYRSLEQNVQLQRAVKREDKSRSASYLTAPE